MTPAQLKNEILTGPLAGELAPLWEAGDDANVSVVLMRPDYAGYIPPVPLLKYLETSRLQAPLSLIRDHLLLPPGDPMEPATVAAPYVFYELASCLLSSVAKGFRPSVGDMTVGAAALVGAGVMTEGQKADVLALEVKIGRAQVVWGYDADITPLDIELARKS